MLSFENAAALRLFGAAGLDEGELVFLRSFRDYFVLSRLSRPADDGVSTIRGESWCWRRLNVPHPSWMERTDWTIDPTNGDNENSGSATAPIKDDLERQRRMGPCPLWGPNGITSYDINILGDIDNFTFAGAPHPSATASVGVRVHGNAGTGVVTGAGKSPALFSGGGVSDTFSALNAASDLATRLVATDLGTGINPANWTALLSKRVRWTSGTNIGAAAWVMRDNAAAVAQQGQLTSPVTKNFSTTVVAPATGDTFVVEDVVQVKFWTVSAQGNGILQLLVEGVKIGRRDSTTGLVSIAQGAVTQSYWGCHVWNLSAFGAPQASPTFINCLFDNSGAAIVIPAMQAPSFQSGGATKQVEFRGALGRAVAGITFRGGFYIQGGHLLLVNGPCTVTDIAVFDPPAGPMIQIANGATLKLGAGGGWSVYGGLNVAGANNVSWTFLLNSARVTEDGQANNTHDGTAAMISLNGSGNTCDRYDRATRAFLAAANLTKANYFAALGSGGFGRQVVDPFGGSQFVAA
jgi:hypothetical protein